MRGTAWLFKADILMRAKKPFLLLLILAAWTLRVSTLTLQSLWLDEVMALYFTRGTLAETLRTIVRPEDNGPLFYLLLFGWRHLAGDSDFAVRFLSVLFSVLTMPMVYRLAAQLLGWRAAALTTGMIAFSPFTLWFAQEAKMYALHMMAATASTLMLLEAFQKGKAWRWAGYALALSFTLYSHFFGGFLAVAQGIMSILLGWRRWKRWLAYGLTMLIIALTHLPLLNVGWRVIRGYQPRDPWRAFMPLGDIARDMLARYFYRLSYAEAPWFWLLPPALLLVAGIFSLRHARRREAGILLVQALAPVLIFYPISYRVPVYAANYLSATLPALFTLTAWGVERMARLWRPLALIGATLGLLMLGSTWRDLTNPAYQRSDWRFIARYVEDHEGPSDLVVISAFYAIHPFQRYYRGTSAVFPFESNPYEPEPLYRYFSSRYARMWLILHHAEVMAPGHRLLEAADAMFPRITGQYPNRGQIALIGYQLRFTYPQLPDHASPLSACFQNGICLVGYQVDATGLPARERLSHPPSNWLHVVLYWQRSGPFDGVPFRPLVRLIDDAFNVWGGELDRHPDLLDHYPPQHWPTNQVVEQHFDVNLNPNTPPGIYRLEVSLAINGNEQQRVLLVPPPHGMPPDRIVFENIRVLPGR